MLTYLVVFLCELILAMFAIAKIYAILKTFIVCLFIGTAAYLVATWLGLHKHLALIIALCIVFFPTFIHWIGSTVLEVLDSRL